jgi:hypothetical protein
MAFREPRTSHSPAGAELPTPTSTETASLPSLPDSLPNEDESQPIPQENTKAKLHDIFKWMHTEAGTATAALSAAEASAGQNEQRMDELSAIGVPADMFTPAAVKAILSSIQTGILVKAFGLCKGSRPLNGFKHIYIDMKTNRLFGDAGELLKVDEKMYFVGNRVSLQKTEGKSFAIVEIRCTKPPAGVLMDLPVYINADTMADLSTDPESCVSPAWFARKVADETPTCELGWDDVEITLDAGVAEWLEVSKYTIKLPYLSINKATVREMIARAKAASSSSASPHAQNIIELTRAPGGATTRAGGRSSKGKKDQASVSAFFGSVGFYKDYLLNKAAEMKMDGADEKDRCLANLAAISTVFSLATPVPVSFCPRSLDDKIILGLGLVRPLFPTTRLGASLWCAWHSRTEGSAQIRPSLTKRLHPIPVPVVLDISVSSNLVGFVAPPEASGQSA